MATIHREARASSAANASDCISDVISIRDLTLAQIQRILSVAAKMKAERPHDILKNKIIANCFFEPSTRTRLSFEAAALRLGGNVIGFAGDESTSVKKGETLQDTIRVVADYADLIVIRHASEGAARLAADISDKPVINAGDGANQHPTQALIDLFTIQECQQRLDGLSIALSGDLKYGRAIHSFIQICMLFDIRLFLVAPPMYALPEATCDALKNAGVRFSFHHSLEEVIPKVDILYMSRIQQERFHHASHSPQEKPFILTPAMLNKAKPNLKVLHPLPRVKEIDTAVDAMPQAYYFQQAAKGVCVRQALLSLLLNEGKV
jgi:aspartate carbamoyltransferase catalytic subunit